MVLPTNPHSLLPGTSCAPRHEEKCVCGGEISGLVNVLALEFCFHQTRPFPSDSMIHTAELALDFPVISGAAFEIRHCCDYLIQFRPFHRLWVGKHQGTNSSGNHLGIAGAESCKNHLRKHMQGARSSFHCLKYSWPFR